MKVNKALRYFLLILAVLAIKCDCNDDDRPIFDTDNDGVTDVEDLCPNTIEGETVDEFGCSSLEINDLDRDGVVNEQDECPNTPVLPEGIVVNANGCLEEAVRTYPEGIITQEVPNQIILSGFSNLTPEQIDAVQEELNIEQEAIKTCSCDETIQLWTLPDDIDLDGAIGRAKSKGGTQLSGDKNFTFAVVAEQTNYGIFPEQITSPSLSNDINKPIVAILDSGLDVNQLNFQGLQLLDTQTINQDINCIDPNSGTVSRFGWNFSDGNADMSEDETSHGTNVTKTFIKNLNNINLNEFQILPLKLFSGSSPGSYWDVVCAFSYLVKLDSLGYDIALVNTSFGGQLESLQSNENSDEKDLLVLKELIDVLNETVVVSSAGNNQNDNDFVPYFPASYNSSKWFDSPVTNLLAVAGHDSKLSPEIFEDIDNNLGSNFGKETVDMAAPWHFTILEDGTRPFPPLPSVKGIELTGTSFSAPIVSALLLEHYLDTSLKGEQLKTNFLDNSNYIKINASLNNSVKNNKYVLSN